MSRRTLDQARSFWVEGLDPLLGGISAYGEGGLQLLDEGIHPDVRSGAFGHQGPGGIAYQAWPLAGTGAALVRSRLTAGPGAQVLDAVADAVAEADAVADAHAVAVADADAVARSLRASA